MTDGYFLLILDSVSHCKQRASVIKLTHKWQDLINSFVIVIQETVYFIKKCIDCTNDIDELTTFPIRTLSWSLNKFGFLYLIFRKDLARNPRSNRNSFKGDGIDISHFWKFTKTIFFCIFYSFNSYGSQCHFRLEPLLPLIYGLSFFKSKQIDIAITLCNPLF